MICRCYRHAILEVLEEGDEGWAFVDRNHQKKGGKPNIKLVLIFL